MVFIEKKSNVHDKIKLLVDKVKVKFRRSLLKLETSILKSFNRNPFKCKHCDKRLKYLATITFIRRLLICLILKIFQLNLVEKQ